jgi:hypothetical protein
MHTGKPLTSPIGEDSARWWYRCFEAVTKPVEDRRGALTLVRLADEEMEVTLLGSVDIAELQGALPGIHKAIMLGIQKSSRS